MFEAYITNTALYPLMGIEVGTTVHFPMTTQELQAALAKIGIDGKRYSEVFFTSFDSDVLGLYDHLYECENIDELNELGHALLEVRDKGGLETFEAALVLGNHTRSVKDLINLTQNLDLYRFYPDISDDEGLGRLYADELGTIEIPEHIQNYFDYEAYGRGFLKPFECSENGVDRLGLFRIGKYPVFRRNVLRPVVILLEALRDCRHIPTGSEYAALVDTHIPPVCLIIEVVLNVLRYVDSPKLVGIKTAQPFIIGNIRVKAVKVKVLRQVYQILHAPCVVSQDKSGFKEYYHGPQDIPPEHRIFAYPEKAEPVHSILATLKRFQEAPPAPKKDKAGPSHEER